MCISDYAIWNKTEDDERACKENSVSQVTRLYSFSHPCNNNNNNLHTYSMEQRPS